MKTNTNGEETDLQKFVAHYATLQNQFSDTDGKLGDLNRRIMERNYQYQQRKNDVTFLMCEYPKEMAALVAENNKLNGKVMVIQNNIVDIQRGLQERANIRAEALGTPPVKVIDEYNNDQTRDLQNVILRLRRDIDTTESKIQELKKRRDNIGDPDVLRRDTKEEASKLKAEYRKIMDTRKTLRKKIRIMKKLIQLEENREKYERYAKKNRIISARDKDDDNYLQDLIKSCNEYHQSRFLENEYVGYNAKPHCCGSFYIATMRRCDCGTRWKWNQEGFDPSDLEQFTIDNDEPYGHLENF